MEVKKYTIAGEVFTMKFPSYKRCERVREVMGEEIVKMQETGKVSDIQKFLDGMKECLDGNFDILVADEISIGQMEILTGVMNDFFILSREIV